MTYLLDTATWANHVTMPEVLPARIRRLLQTPEAKGLCSVSLLECAIHHRLGRLDITGELREFFAAGLAADISLLELTPAVACATNELPVDFPGDPFDRAIVATAACLGLILVTADPAIRQTQACPVEYYPFRPSRLNR
jgi:PIN domain nuclease of toxin-antitoxin system